MTLRLLSPYIALAFIGCVSDSSGPSRTVARPHNPKIARLVAELSSGPATIDDGGYPIIELPRNATPSQVAAQCINMTGFVGGRIKHYEIRAIEKVPSYDGEGDLTAVLIASDFGEKIIFMRYEAPGGRWWTHMYDVK
jgi:hypothetical protein